MKGRIIPLLLSVVLVASTCTQVSAAYETTDLRIPAIETHTVEYTNPMYQDVVIDIDATNEQDQVQVFSLAKTYTTTEAAGSYLRELMKERVASVTIKYQTTDRDYESIANEIFENAIQHTGAPTEGDYLYYQCGGYGCSINISFDGTQYTYVYDYQLRYYTSAEQEDVVDEKIDDVLNDLNVKGKSDYEKIKTIYDYVCETVTYDDETLNDLTYKLKYTAYAALIDQTAVCQGYANLMYRLLCEVGVDNRIVSGIGNGGPHAWNLVELNGKYYYLDATWDAGESTYRYFLKGATDFVNHTPESGYINEYDIAQVAFDPANQEMPEENPFTDVITGEFYYNPVLWAFTNGITTGLSATTFGPNETCTRGQVVTFLWRSQGCPAPETTVNPFRDVAEGEFYYDAVLWAYENGITTGLSATTFAPNEKVTRGQFVTFLWRAEGKDQPSTSNPFRDVAEGEFYYDSILWAYENGVTTGLSATTFGPNESCTRGQVVTFLYRTFAE